MSLIKKLASETAIYGLSSIVGRLLNYLLVPMYTRIFSNEEYAVITELYAWVGVLMVVFTYRMETGFFRFGTPAEERERVFSTIMWSLLATTVLLAGSMILWAEPIAVALRYSGNAEYIWWFALILGLDALSAVPFARLRLENKPWRFAAIKLLNIGLNIGLNLFFLLLCPYLAARGYGWMDWYDVRIGVGYVILSNLAASALTLLLLLPVLLRMQGRYDRALMWRMLGYAAPLIVVGLASVINELFDRIMLKWLLPEAEGMKAVGVYGAVYKLAMLMSLFTQAFNYAAEPFFFANAQNRDAQQIYAQVAKLFAMVGSVAFLGILLYLDVVKHFLGGDFHSGLHVVPMLLLANLALGLYYNFAIWYKLKDKTHIGAWIAIAGAAVTVVLNVLLVRQFSYVASAWATLACYTLMAALAYGIGQRYYPIPYAMRRILGYIGAAVALYAVSVLLQPWLLGTVAVYGIHTALMGIYLAGLWRYEGAWLKGVMRG